MNQPKTMVDQNDTEELVKTVPRIYEEKTEIDFFQSYT